MGFVLTAAWVGVTAFYVYSVVGWYEFMALTPSEFGDFFVDFAAPLAFLWFVIGYFQQGEELRLQRKELSLQREEVHRLANEAEKQADAIQANEMHAQRNTFLRVSQMVIDEQNGLVAKILKGSGRGGQVGHAWEAFGDGDKNAMFQIGIDVIKGLEAKGNLHLLGINLPDSQSILQLCDNFENLISDAEKCDPDKFLRRQFEHSPMGTLYAGLCFANHRKILFEVREKPTDLDQIYSM